MWLTRSYEQSTQNVICLQISAKLKFKLVLTLSMLPAFICDGVYGK
jgi:hypothetical protein